MTESLTEPQKWTIARLAYWYLDRRRVQEAEALARGLIALDNRHGPGWLYYGEARRQQGDLGGALQGFEQAAQLMADRSDLWMRLGEIQLRLGRGEEARRSLEKARAIGGDEAVTQRVLALLGQCKKRVNQ